MNPVGERTREGRTGERRSFTVIELLVGLAVIVLFASLLTRGSWQSQRSAALQSGPAVVARQFTLARAKAMALQQTTRVLVNIDPASMAEPPRFLRHLVVQARVGGDWATISEAYLPDGVYVVPGKFSDLPAGLLGEREAMWVKADGTTLLRSTVLRSNRIGLEPVQGATAEEWARVEFAAAGTTSQDGDVVLALGRPRVPGTFAAGEAPVLLDGPESVCGLSLSQYGAVVFIHDRASF